MKTDCPECDGHGYVLVDVGQYGPPETVLTTCPYCRGEGEIKEDDSE